MKVNVFMTILALLASALVVYVLFSQDCTALQISVYSLLFALFAVTGMGISIKDYPRSTILLKTASFVFLAIVLVLDTVLIKANASSTAFVLTNGIMAIVALATGYIIFNSKQ